MVCANDLAVVRDARFSIHARGINQDRFSKVTCQARSALGEFWDFLRWTCPSSYAAFAGLSVHTDWGNLLATASARSVLAARGSRHLCGAPENLVSFRQLRSIFPARLIKCEGNNACICRVFSHG